MDNSEKDALYQFIEGRNRCYVDYKPLSRLEVLVKAKIKIDKLIIDELDDDTN